MSFQSASSAGSFAVPVPSVTGKSDSEFPLPSRPSFGSLSEPSLAPGSELAVPSGPPANSELS